MKSNQKNCNYQENKNKPQENECDINLPNAPALKPLQIVPTFIPCFLLDEEQNGICKEKKHVTIEIQKEIKKKKQSSNKKKISIIEMLNAKLLENEVE